MLSAVYFPNGYLILTSLASFIIFTESRYEDLSQAWATGISINQIFENQSINRLMNYSIN